MVMMIFISMWVFVLSSWRPRRGARESATSKDVLRTTGRKWEQGWGWGESGGFGSGKKERRRRRGKEVGGR